MLRRSALRSICLFRSVSDPAASGRVLLSEAAGRKTPPEQTAQARSLLRPFAVHHASSWAFWRRSGKVDDAKATWEVESVSGVPEVLDPAAFPLPESSFEAAIALMQAFAAIERASIASARAGVWFGSSWFMSGIEYAHGLGLPWWSAVAAVNLATRLLLFPLVIMSQKATAKMMEANYDSLHAKKLQEAMIQTKNPEEQQRLQQALKQQMAAQDAKFPNMARTAATVPGVLLVNGVVLVSIFGATSGLMESKAPSLLDGGMLWFHNLSVPDPYFGLPVMCCLITLAMVEYGISMTGEQAGPMQQQAQAFKWMMRGMSFMFIPAGSYVTAGTAVLWFSNSAFAVVQGICLRNDGFRKFAGLPTMAEMKAMAEKVAAVTKPGASLTPPVASLDVPRDPATGKLLLFTSNPRKPKRIAPPPGQPAQRREVD